MAYAKHGAASGFRITSRAIELYSEAKPLWPGRVKCLNSARKCTHAACRRFGELAVALQAELGFKPRQVDVFDPLPIDPKNPSAFERGWEQVVAARDALDAALGEKP